MSTKLNEIGCYINRLFLLPPDFLSQKYEIEESINNSFYYYHHFFYTIFNTITCLIILKIIDI